MNINSSNFGKETLFCVVLDHCLLFVSRFMRRTFAKVEQMFKLFLIKICEHIEMTWIVNQLLILLFY